MYNRKGADCLACTQALHRVTVWPWEGGFASLCRLHLQRGLRLRWHRSSGRFQATVLAHKCFLQVAVCNTEITNCPEPYFHHFWDQPIPDHSHSYPGSACFLLWLWWLVLYFTGPSSCVALCAWVSSVGDLGCTSRLCSGCPAQCFDWPLPSLHLLFHATVSTSLFCPGPPGSQQVPLILIVREHGGYQAPGSLSVLLPPASGKSGVSYSSV